MDEWSRMESESWDGLSSWASEAWEWLDPEEQRSGEARVAPAVVEEEEGDEVPVLKRRGKRLAKAGLTRRFGVEWSEVIKVESRPGSEGTVATTVVDDAIPELVGGSASLGLRHRWDEVAELLERLVVEGRATRLATATGPERGLRAPPPQNVFRYAVSVSGTAAVSAKKQRSSRDSIVYRRHRGSLVEWYRLEAAPGLNAGQEVLRGVLKAPPKARPLSKRGKRAFAPGVAAACGASTVATCVRAACNAVAHSSVELDFSRVVFVSSASIAGKIHDTYVESDEEDDLEPKRYRDNLVVGRRKRVGKLVACDGTDAFCSRVVVSARLQTGWVQVGEYDASTDAHTERFISLADAPLAVPHDADTSCRGIRCFALRFKALAWHRAPKMRVGAYGIDLAAKELKTRAPPNNILHDPDNTVVYVLRTNPLENRDDDDRVALLRKFAHKPRRTAGRWDRYYDLDKKSALRHQLRETIADARKDHLSSQQHRDDDLISCSSS